MIMFRIPVFCIFLLMIAGCSGKSERSDANILPSDSIISEPMMIQILADVHILEAGVQLQKNRGKNPGADAEHLYNGLFRKYRITENRYLQNLDYYRSNPAAFEKFYQKVIAEIDSRKSMGTIPSQEKDD